MAQTYELKTLVFSTNEEAWRRANVKRKTNRDDAIRIGFNKRAQFHKIKVDLSDIRTKLGQIACGRRGGELQNRTTSFVGVDGERA